MSKSFTTNIRKKEILKERDVKLVILEEEFRILKLREEIKELVKIGRKIIKGDKKFTRRETQFREKVQALIKRK